MTERDAHPGLAHPEVAGWLLGSLDPDEAGRFREHLDSCAGCLAAAAELRPVARALGMTAPAVQPPSDLQARTLARVELAARTATARSIWLRWNVRTPSRGVKSP
ncbi:MAG TPA: zf-HC2 domain-containing protein [Streptosporangiaceae bacterium]|nr:zf-HC2 domain-containing protein [Streptosporangiaceae bacterium]